MRVVIMSTDGSAIGIQGFLLREGHQVIAPSTSVTSSDIAVADSTFSYAVVDNARATGARVVGPTVWSHLLRTDATYRDQVISAMGYQQATGAPGTRVSVCTLFNGQRFISVYLSYNYTRFMAGDVGASVPSAGYISVFNVNNTQLVKQLITPAEKFLRKAAHHGFFTIDTVCNDQGVFIESISADSFTPCSASLFENTRMSKADVLLNILNPASSDIPYIDPYVCGVLLSVAPHPFGYLPIPVLVDGINIHNLKHLWLQDASCTENKWYTAGCIGYALARGASVEESRRRAYRTISGLRIPDVQYRIDVGKDVHERMHRLKELKLL